MIEAIGWHQANVLMLEISFPGGLKKEFKSITGETAKEREVKAKALIYSLNKARICDTLCRWLKQRQFGLAEFIPKKSQDAARLLVLIHYYHQFNYFKMCRLIADNSQAIYDIAPPLHSKSFPYYQNTIMPILAECELMKGRNV